MKAFTYGPGGRYDDDDLLRAAQLAYGEARGQGQKGLQAVVQVAVNRTLDKRFPDKLSDVALEPKQFSAFWDNNWNSIKAAPEKDPEGWRAAVMAAHRVLSGQAPNHVGGATNYYAHGTVTPSWAVSKSREGGAFKIGDHTFLGTTMPKDDEAAATVSAYAPPSDASDPAPSARVRAPSLAQVRIDRELEGLLKQISDDGSSASETAPSPDAAQASPPAPPDGALSGGGGSPNELTVNARPQPQGAGFGGQTIPMADNAPDLRYEVPLSNAPSFDLRRLFG